MAERDGEVYMTLIRDMPKGSGHGSGCGTLGRGR